jgi:hypothetical protein
MAKIDGRWIEDNTITGSKLDRSDVYSMVGVNVNAPDGMVQFQDGNASTKWVLMRDSTDQSLRVHSNGNSAQLRIQNNLSSAVPNMVVNTNNSRVGVNTASPDGPFQVYGTNAGGHVASFGRSFGDSVSVVINSGDGIVSGYSELFFQQNGSTKWKVGSTDSTYFRVYNTGVGTALQISPAGAVGITSSLTVGSNLGVGGSVGISSSLVVGNNLTVNGTTTIVNTEITTTDKFEIDQTSAQEALVVNKSNLGIGTAVRIINAGSDPAMTVTGTGNVAVGIGTANPLVPLHVVGSIRSFTSGTNYSQHSDNELIVYGSDGYLSTGTAGRSLVFRTDAASEKMRVTSTGFVGIGTTNPLAYLHIYKNSADSYLLVESAVSGTGALGLFGLKAANNDFGSIYFGNYGVVTGQISAKRDSANDAASLCLSTQATGGSLTERIRVTSIGHIGIGTTDAGSIITTREQVLDTSINILQDSYTGDLTGTVSIVPGFRKGDGLFRNAGQILWGKEGNYSNNANASSFLRFDTASAGTSTERMRISSTGYVGIGTSNPTDHFDICDLTPSMVLHTNKDVGASEVMGVINFTANSSGVQYPGASINAAVAPAAPWGPGATSHGTVLKFNTVTLGGSGSPTTRMMISQYGTVGIGTLNPDPTYTLHVYGSAPWATVDGSTESVVSVRSRSTTGYSAINLTNNVNAGFFMYSYGSALPGTSPWGLPYASLLEMYSTAPNGFVLYTATTTPMLFGTNGVERMRIASNGFVGIGTSSPTVKFHVDGDSYFQGSIIVPTTITYKVGIGSTSPGTKLDVQALNTGTSPTMRVSRFGGNVTDPVFTLRNQAVNIFDVTLGGKVGIGTTNPLSMLHVEANDLDTGGTLMLKDSAGPSSILIDCNSINWYPKNDPTVRRAYIWSWGAGAPANGLGFHTGAAGTQRMYIADGGDINMTGNLNVVGTLTKGGGGFLIDHPTKPNYSLYHGFVESPEYGLIYRGTSQLIDGTAVVGLPDYFESLTKPDKRTVQLTCIDGWSPIYVSGDVTGGQFTVLLKGSDGTDQKFHWAVQAVRNDAFVHDSSNMYTDEEGNMRVEILKDSTGV